MSVKAGGAKRVGKLMVLERQMDESFFFLLMIKKLFCKYDPRMRWACSLISSRYSTSSTFFLLTKDPPTASALL